MYCCQFALVITVPGEASESARTGGSDAAKLNEMATTKALTEVKFS